jgi:hypothetical protein
LALVLCGGQYLNNYRFRVVHRYIIAWMFYVVNRVDNGLLCRQMGGRFTKRPYR